MIEYGCHVFDLTSQVLGRASGLGILREVGPIEAVDSHAALRQLFCYLFKDWERHVISRTRRENYGGERSLSRWKSRNDVELRSAWCLECHGLCGADVEGHG